MIPELVGYITRSEGRKFLKLRPEIDDAVVTASGLNDNVSLYIHIPFCRSLCPFCCFNRYLFKEDRARAYFVSLRKEIDLYIQRGFKFSEFYFGGGTPTILMDELAGLIDYLKRNFDVKRISLETTPREITTKTIELLQAAGINRLSIGIQSFNDDTLKTMGRLFISGKEAKQRLMMAQGKFDTVNADFVFNFPNQSIGQFEADVKMFKDMGIDQATFYPLMASPHKKDALERRFNKVNFSREKAFYDVIMKELYAAGYDASTAWCFSRGKKMIDEYVIDSDDYIGVGSGSVSIVNGNFFVNSFALEKYAALIDSHKLPIVGWRKISRSEHLRYYLLTKLFGLEVDEDRFRARFHADMNTMLPLEVMFLKLSGVIRGGGKLKVTEKGMYPVSVMMREFFASLNGLREDYIENQI